MLRKIVVDDNNINHTERARAYNNNKNKLQSMA